MPFVHREHQVYNVLELKSLDIADQTECDGGEDLYYYLANREQVEAYLERVRQRQEEAWLEQQRHPSEFVRSLRERLERERYALREGKPLSFSMGRG